MAPLHCLWYPVSTLNQKEKLYGTHYRGSPGGRQPGGDLRRLRPAPSGGAEDRGCGGAPAGPAETAGRCPRHSAGEPLFQLGGPAGAAQNGGRRLYLHAGRHAYCPGFEGLGEGLPHPAGEAHEQHRGGVSGHRGRRPESGPGNGGVPRAALHPLLPDHQGPGGRRGDRGGLRRRPDRERGLLAPGPQLCTGQLAQQPGDQSHAAAEELPRYGHPPVAGGKGLPPGQQLWEPAPFYGGQCSCRGTGAVSGRLPPQ